MPHLALATVSKHVCDPVLYLLLRALSLWRSLMCHDEVGSSTLQGFLCNASDGPNLAYGPASALKCYLKHINWYVNGEGQFVDHFQRVVDLTALSFKRLVHVVWDAWDLVVSGSSEKGRTTLTGLTLTCISIVSLLSLMIPVTCQQTTLSHLWDTQNSKWVPKEKDDLLPCPLRGGPNSRAHFPCECSGLAALRDEHSETLDAVMTEFPHLLFLPVLYKHPKFSLLQTLHDARELPEPFNLLDLCGDFVDCPVFYTDGSCIRPELPVARFSALLPWYSLLLARSIYRF